LLGLPAAVLVWVAVWAAGALAAPGLLPPPPPPPPPLPRPHAQVLMELEQYEEAARVLRRVSNTGMFADGIATLRDHVATLKATARDVYSNNEFADAGTLYTSAIRVATALAEVSAERAAAGAAEAGGQRADGDSIATPAAAAVVAVPVDHTLYSNRAACSFQTRNFRNVIADCEHAIRVCPTFVRAYVRAAQACYERRDFEGAARFCEAGLGVEPGHADLQREVERARLARRAMAEAAEGEGNGCNRGNSSTDNAENRATGATAKPAAGAAGPGAAAGQAPDAVKRRAMAAALAAAMNVTNV
jgi:hypothetical protein